MFAELTLLVAQVYAYKLEHLPSVDQAAAQNLRSDFFNEALLPESVHVRLTKRSDRDYGSLDNLKPDARQAKIRAWVQADSKVRQSQSVLAEATYKSFSPQRKKQYALKMCRQQRIMCLTYREPHQLIKTTDDQRQAMMSIIHTQNEPFSNGKRYDQFEDHATKLRQSAKIRSLLTLSQRAALAKYLGGDSFLTAPILQYGPIGAFYYDGGLGSEATLTALGFPESRVKEIAKKNSAIAATDGTKANGYLAGIERGLSVAQKQRLEELRWQATGAENVLNGFVAAKIGLRAERIEEISLKSAKLTLSRHLESSRPRKGTKDEIQLQILKFSEETFTLNDALIMGMLTPGQNQAWSRLQGKPEPKVARSVISKRFFATWVESQKKRHK